MTGAPSVLMKRSAQPVTCMACARQSTGIGIHEPRRPPSAWTCDDPQCVKATRHMTAMPLPKLNAIEVKAIGEAAMVISEPMMRAAIDALYAAGCRNLDAISADHVNLALDSLHITGEAAAVAKQALLAFGEAIRRDVLSDAAPF
jgi:hypothetical protein